MCVCVCVCVRGKALVMKEHTGLAGCWQLSTFSLRLSFSVSSLCNNWKYIISSVTASDKNQIVSFLTQSIHVSHPSRINIQSFQILSIGHSDLSILDSFFSSPVTYGPQGTGHSLASGTSPNYCPSSPQTPSPCHGLSWPPHLNRSPSCYAPSAPFSDLQIYFL